MAPKVWKIKTTIDDRRTSEQHHENEAVIKNASDKTCPKSTTMPPKAWKIKNTVVASDHQQQEAGIMNPVVASDHQQQETGIISPVVASDHQQQEAGIIDPLVASDGSEEQKDEKETGIINPVVASDHQQQEAGIIDPLVASDESEEQKDEKETGIDSGILLDRLQIGSKKKLLVLPLRGIIVHRAHRSRPETISRNRRPDFCYGKFLVYKRPFCLDFLKFCFERFHVGLWSSAKEYNLQGILTNVMGDLKNKLLFTWDQEHCTDSGFMCLENQDKPLFLKELDHLWQKKYPNLPWGDEEYSASNTLLIASPEKALLNPPNTAIFPLNYDPANKKDDFLGVYIDLCNNIVLNTNLRSNDAKCFLLGPKGELRVFLEGLAEAEDVQSYVQDHPIGEPEILPSHPDWDYYCKIICYINKKRNSEKKKLI
ncbi:hypothetical protein R6Q59_027569 [Mikania micrantha]